MPLRLVTPPFLLHTLSTYCLLFTYPFLSLPCLLPKLPSLSPSLISPLPPFHSLSPPSPSYPYQSSVVCEVSCCRVGPAAALAVEVSTLLAVASDDHHPNPYDVNPFDDAIVVRCVSQRVSHSHHSSFVTRHSTLH